MPDRKPLISGNWKLNYNHLEAIQVVQKLSYQLRADDYDAADVSVHPTFTSMRSVQIVLETDKIPIALGAQNCFWEDSGAFTGEVSAPMLAKLNVAYVIIGHSERREVLGEADEHVRRKLEAVWRSSMTPILCVGETLEEREAGGPDEKVSGQIRSALTGFPAEQVSGMVIAYEPIWAIGTGKTATPDDAQTTIGLIRRLVSSIHGDAVAAAIRLQYGGSVKATNIGELMAQPDIDGALVGGSSLDPDEFARIVRYRDA